MFTQKILLRVEEFLSEFEKKKKNLVAEEQPSLDVQAELV